VEYAHSIDSTPVRINLEWTDLTKSRGYNQTTIGPPPPTAVESDMFHLIKVSGIVIGTTYSVCTINSPIMPSV